jgi:hypothetical protein
MQNDMSRNFTNTPLNDDNLTLFCIKASGLLPGVILGMKPTFRTNVCPFFRVNHESSCDSPWNVGCIPRMTPGNNPEAFMQNNDSESLQSYNLPLCRGIFTYNEKWNIDRVQFKLKLLTDGSIHKPQHYPNLVLKFGVYVGNHGLATMN